MPRRPRSVLRARRSGPITAIVVATALVWGLAGAAVAAGGVVVFDRSTVITARDAARHMPGAPAALRRAVVARVARDQRSPECQVQGSDGPRASAVPFGYDARSGRGAAFLAFNSCQSGGVALLTLTRSGWRTGAEPVDGSFRCRDLTRADVRPALFATVDRAKKCADGRGALVTYR